jgi:hypothetical protein
MIEVLKTLRMAIDSEAEYYRLMDAHLLPLFCQSAGAGQPLAVTSGAQR